MGTAYLEQTLDYYETQAEEYVQRTRLAPATEGHHRFVAHLPPQARILDAGCGSGRDTLYFRSLGFTVVPFDGAPAMAAAAGAMLGESVPVWRFEDLPRLLQPAASPMRAGPRLRTGEFDGIWACASLLHLASRELDNTLRVLWQLLAPRGVLCASFIEGRHRRREGERHYFDTDPPRLQRACARSGGRVVDIFATDDVLGRSRRWLNLIAVRSDCP